jgi:hypothetical protein
MQITALLRFKTEAATFKPQIGVWALRKKFGSVKDIALGLEGSIIVCTESGHVFLGTRNAIVSSSVNNYSNKSGGSGTGRGERLPNLSVCRCNAGVCE